MEMMRIGEVAEQAGVATSTLRYYESIGLLPEPARVSGRRQYAPSILRDIAAIQLAQAAGFSLAEMKILLIPAESSGLSAQWQELAPQKINEIEQMIVRLQEMKAKLQAGLDCECQGLTDCHAVTERMEAYPALG